MLFHEKRILVPIDGSEPSYRALALAVQLARVTGGYLDIISVIDFKNVEAFEGYMMTEQQFEDLKISVREEVLDQAKARMGAEPPPHRTRLMWGGVAQVLLREAEEEDVGMVIVGRTGKGFFGRLLEGSISRALSTHCKVPVVVVP